MARAATRAVDPEPDYGDPPRRRAGGRGLGFFLVTPALLFVAYAVLRIAGIESTEVLVAAMALTPYLAAFGLVLGLLCVLTRRRVVGITVLLLAIGLGTLLVPRVLSEEQPAVDGDRLRIMSLNLFVGRADPRTVFGIARDQKIDVLVMPEVTPAAEAALDELGLAELLPNRVSDTDATGSGTAVASRFPLRQIVLMDESTLAQPSMVVDMPGSDDVELTAVHIQPGVRTGTAGTWRTELAELPRPAERIRVLAGDFNASFDHAAFRELMDRGYADAAESTGDGLSATWRKWPLGPPVTIDHILVDDRCAIAGYEVFDVGGTDHDALVSELILP
ncbi:endonuclease/exonuclease/phosphatase family protein [Actinophytocola sp.]|uniref:endonuclease/exonuclease/phosphatase family protein n=1 Tax=Actinophytocola sp. TaxID=1872138 RepID=UPI003D6A6540